METLVPQELWYKEDYAIVSSAMPYATPYESINSGCTSFLLPIGCSGLAVLSKFPIVEVNFCQAQVQVQVG